MTSKPQSRLASVRMVPPESLTTEMVLLPPIKEHLYERKMEKKLQEMVAEEEEKEKQNRKP